MKVRIRICPTCSQLISSHACFCKSCFSLIRSEISKSPAGPIRQGHHTIKPVFLWGAGSSKVVRRLLYSLKGGEFPHVFAWLASVHRARFASLNEGKLALLSPPVSLKWGNSDHASIWTRELCSRTPGAFSYSPYLSRDKVSQKTLALSQRKATQKMTFKEPRVRSLSAMSRALKVVFCDDIYSSGETAKSCLKPVGFGKEAEVWCIAYRKSSRGEQLKITP